MADRTDVEKEHRMKKGCLLIACCFAAACESDESDEFKHRARTVCAAPDAYADKRAAFIADCIRGWNPGEEDWAKRIGDDCRDIAFENWPRSCSEHAIEVTDGWGGWRRCDAASVRTGLGGACRAAGYRGAE